MTPLGRKHYGVTVLPLLTLVVLLPLIGRSQSRDSSAHDLVRFLTYQSDRPGKPLVLAGLSSCGRVKQDRAAARSLAELGATAIPDIERALDAIEKRGESSEYALGAGWLLDSYVHIKGPAGFPRVRRMMRNPNLAFLGLDLDGAAALSLGLTSYVSDSHAPGRVFHCSRGGEPRDPLDQLILAWEWGDRPWLEASLGPRATAALNSLLEARTWADMRAEIWHAAIGRRVAVGYRFDISGRWAEPEETLDEERAAGTGVIPENPDLDTRFKNGSAGDCGRFRVKFLKTPIEVGPGYLAYVVDNSDLGNLLRLISSCAAGEPAAGQR